MKKCRTFAAIFILFSISAAGLSAQNKTPPTSNPPQKGPPPSSQPSGPPPAPPSAPPGQKRNSPQKNPQDIINYRGTRLSLSGEPFFVTDISPYRSETGGVNLEIRFNRIINPRSVKADSITIDGNPLPENAKFSFNRKGDTIKLTFPEENNAFVLKIQNIASYEGISLEAAEFYEVINEDSGS